ncbi:pyruvate formate lyase family protein [Planctomycetota bacterium]
MSVQCKRQAAFEVKKPYGLSERIQWLRDYYFEGVKRPWRNEFTAWTTGTPWDVVYDEISYHIVPESYPFFQAFRSSAHQAARPVGLHRDFWSWSLPERRAWFIKEVMVNHVPQEILPGDLLAGGRFNLLASRCWSEEEAKARDELLLGPGGAREAAKWFHEHGYGNAGATSGHLIPDHERVLRIGWKGIYEDLESRYQRLSPAEQKLKEGCQLRAMKQAATMPRDLARKYANLCRNLAGNEEREERRDELLQMAQNLDRVPWLPAKTFWEALQALWLNHMLVMSDECYPGPGVSFGRIDQYLHPYWQHSLRNGVDRNHLKETLKCFWIHCNTAYDAMIGVGGNQGITAGFGQLLNLSGLGPAGTDMTNDLTYAILEVIDEMTPLLEPKPNVRLHRRSPDELLDRVVDMVAKSQGAPFLLNFDERAIAGLMREAREAGVEHLIHEQNVHDYASVGCLENTMVGNDRSGTVDCNLNLLKAVELALTGGRDLIPAVDPLTGKQAPIRQDGPATGDSTAFTSWEQLFDAYMRQTRYLVEACVDLYEKTEAIRAAYCPTPYLSCLVRGCASRGLDVTEGGAELSFVTIEGVTFATTVDSLLAVRSLVFEDQKCTMAELIQALRDNWEGHERLQAFAKFRTPKYGRDDDRADELARKVMDVWTNETWRHRTLSTRRRFRPGMLSWNYWVSDGHIMAASADGRPKGKFLSNAICPANGADTKGPTANTNSVGKALGGFAKDGDGDFEDYLSSLPNGASHTITFNPQCLRDPAHRSKFKAFLRGYARNGGTALQINMLDQEMLKEAQRHPQDYPHLLVRVTGYNAYFTSIGRELQDEIIARESHALA